MLARNCDRQDTYTAGRSPGAHQQVYQAIIRSCSVIVSCLPHYFLVFPYNLDNVATPRFNMTNQQIINMDYKFSRWSRSRVLLTEFLEISAPSGRRPSCQSVAHDMG